MHRFLSLVSRFGRDERGVFAVIFGLMAIVLIALGGAVVDYVSLEQARNRAQLALDAAALALQPEVFNEPVNIAGITSKAQNLLRDRLGIVEDSNESGLSSDVIDVQVNVAEGSLLLVADMEMPTIFVSLVGVQSMTAQIRSEATRKKLALEVAFVLDNSGSMSLTDGGTRQRIQFLKDAARCAVNILFYKDVTDSVDTCIPAAGATKLEDVKVGVVPFTMFVNVGAGNSNAAWIDTTGASVISNDNFDNDDNEDVLPTVALPSRGALFAATGEAWRGCVEARPHIKSGTLATEYLDTDDTAALAGNALFVPMLSPDAADTVGGKNYLDDDAPICDRPNNGVTPSTCTQTQLRTNCNGSMSNGSCTTQPAGTPVPGGSTNFFSNTKYTGAFYGTYPPSCNCRTWTNYSGWSHQSGSNNNQTWVRTRTCSSAGYIPTGLSNREYFERICKYHQAPTVSNFSNGPNADCTRTAILPLTDTPATAINTINSMIAEGGTNIHEGTAWGFRALSPSEPFAQGAPYDEATSKVMIVMTDGENTAYNLSNPNYCNATGMRAFLGSCFNSAYGFPYNSRNTTAGSTSNGNVERLGILGATNAALVTGMNERTRQTCENAKAAGIIVYTIGLATAAAVQSTQAEVEDMLTDCASTPDKAHFPEDPSELKEVFRDIADDLTALRLAQ